MLSFVVGSILGSGLWFVQVSLVCSVRTRAGRSRGQGSPSRSWILCGSSQCDQKTRVSVNQRRGSLARARFSVAGGSSVLRGPSARRCRVPAVS